MHLSHLNLNNNEGFNIYSLNSYLSAENYNWSDNFGVRPVSITNQINPCDVFSFTNSTKNSNYIVTCSTEEDILNIFDTLVTEGSGCGCLQPSIKCVDYLYSDNYSCIFELTPEQVIELNKIEKIKQIVRYPLPEPIPIYSQNIIPNRSTQQNPNHDNYALSRCIQLSSINLQNVFNYTKTGSGVDVVIVDTGIVDGHPEWLSPTTGESRLKKIDWTLFHPITSPLTNVVTLSGGVLAINGEAKPTFLVWDHYNYRNGGTRLSAAPIYALQYTFDVNALENTGYNFTIGKSPDGIALSSVYIKNNGASTGFVYLTGYTGQISPSLSAFDNFLFSNTLYYYSSSHPNSGGIITKTLYNTLNLRYFTDSSGHGTHTTSTACGSSFGWAKESDIYVMKSIGNLASTTGIFDNATVGLPLILAWHKWKKTQPSLSGRPTVCSNSWGYTPGIAGSQSSAIGNAPALQLSLDSVNTLVRELVNEGVHFIKAAGNSNLISSNFEDELYNVAPIPYLTYEYSFVALSGNDWSFEPLLDDNTKPLDYAIYSLSGNRVMVTGGGGSGENGMGYFKNPMKFEPNDFGIINDGNVKLRSSVFCTLLLSGTKAYGCGLNMGTNFGRNALSFYPYNLYYSKLQPISGNWIDGDIGGTVTLLLSTDHTLYGFGANTQGNLGIGEFVPGQVGSSGYASFVAVSGYGWPFRPYSLDSDMYLPVLSAVTIDNQIITNPKWDAIRTSTYCSFALSANTKKWFACGLNTSGDLGLSLEFPATSAAERPIGFIGQDDGIITTGFPVTQTYLLSSFYTFCRLYFTEISGDWDNIVISDKAANGGTTVYAMSAETNKWFGWGTNFFGQLSIPLSGYIDFSVFPPKTYSDKPINYFTPISLSGNWSKIRTTLVTTFALSAGTKKWSVVGSKEGNNLGLGEEYKYDWDNRNVQDYLNPQSWPNYIVSNFVSLTGDWDDIRPNFWVTHALSGGKLYVSGLGVRGELGFEKREPQSLYSYRSGSPHWVSWEPTGPIITVGASAEILLPEKEVIVVADEDGKFPDNTDTEEIVSLSGLSFSEYIAALSGTYETKDWYSNYGPAIDVYAPGSFIQGAYRFLNDPLNPSLSATYAYKNGIYGNYSSAKISGTSMACPQVAGIIATILEDYPNATPQQIKDFIKANAIKNITNKPNIEYKHKPDPEVICWNGTDDRWGTWWRATYQENPLFLYQYPAKKYFFDKKDQKQLSLGNKTYALSGSFLTKNSPFSGIKSQNYSHSLNELKNAYDALT